MTQLKDLVVFRDDLYFEGAVQADWFYQSRQVEAVAKSFVFHGPKNHAVSRDDFGGHGLLDTASFALRLARKMENAEENNGMTLAIAGYGTGKSHLAVTLSTLFSGEQYMPELHEAILENVARADADVERQLRPLVKKPRLVLTLNGMRDFNLHYELLRTAEKALNLYGADQNVLSKLNKVKETAAAFLERSFDILESRFEKMANEKGVFLQGQQLKLHLLQSLDNEIGNEFDIINEVYTEFNGHPIRLDEGVSAGLVLDTLLSESCGLHGQFDSIVILFDEFGRFLEYVSANPSAAGDSALQQIFESVQNADGDIQFVGFIQSDIKSYLQRVDKSSNISRYIDRYDAGEKIYLSSNLETIFANLLEKKDKDAFEKYVSSNLTSNESKQRALFTSLQKWLPLQGIWNQWEDYQRVILEAIYPLHPISTYLLCNLTDWLQSRSSLTLLSEKVRMMGSQEINPALPLPLIYPVDLLKGAFFDELLNAENQGRQRSQFCILLDSIYRKFNTKLTNEARSVLLANLILRICRFHFEKRDELIAAIQECSGLTFNQISSAVQLLEDEYAVLSYDDRLVCFDFVADSVGANEFRNYLKAAQNRRMFLPDMLMQNDIQELADILKPIDTDFGAKNGIQTREWSFIQRMDHIQNVTDSTVEDAYRELEKHTLPNTERGTLLWLYTSKESSVEKIDKIVSSLNAASGKQAFVVMILDDSDNGLQDAILAYRILADMKQEDKIRFQRFYADAYEKAKEKVTLLFSDLKQQRKTITANGIETVSKRLKVYLTSVFEKVYPRVVPFDFDGFDAKGSNGTAYKNFCSIMKWILMDDMSYVALKSQSSDVKNRVDSLLGPYGVFSWRILSSEYKSVAPSNNAVSQIYNALENILNTKKVLSYRQIAAQLTAAPYGMNEYAVFMFMSLFSELFSYTTKLDINGTKYSTRAWAEEVVQDKKFDAKLFNRTKLLFVDAGETITRYRNLYTRIMKNTDISRVIALREELEKLKLEDPVPEALEANDELACLRLSEGERALKYFNESYYKIQDDLESAEKALNPYSALNTALDTQKLSYETYANGKYVYSAELISEMNGLIEEAKRIARAAFEDGWIKRFNCASTDKLGGYRHFAEKACDLFNRFDFVKEALELTSKVEKEAARIQLIIDQEKLINDCENFLLTSQIKPGITQKNLDDLQNHGKELIKEFENFDYESDKQFIDLKARMASRINELNAALLDFKTKLDEIWNAAYDIASLEDVRHVCARIGTMLNSGLTDRDREDLENVDRELSNFLEDMTAFIQKDYSRESLAAACEDAKNQYADNELDVSLVIDGLQTEMLQDMEELEQEWIADYLEIVPSEMPQAELDRWKHDTQPIPRYITEEITSKYNELFAIVENELSKQRMEYLLMLYQQLTKEEQQIFLSKIE